MQTVGRIMHKQRAILVVLLLFAVFIATRTTYGQDVIQLSTEQPEPTPGRDGVTIEVEVDETEANEAAVEVAETTGEATIAVTQRWLDALSAVPQNELLQLILVLGGILLLFGGWRIYDWVVFAAGGFVGAAVLSGLVAPETLMLDVLLALVGFAVGAFLASFVYYAAVFSLGAYLGVVITSAFAGAFGFEALSLTVLLVALVVGGGLFVALASELIIVIAALIGAQLVALTMGLSPIWTVLLALIGGIVQLYLANRAGYGVWRRPRRAWSRRAT